MRRQFCLRLWGELSPTRAATGVPQGSVLGPLLYLIYTNNINTLINNKYSKTFSYADDIALVVSHPNLETCEQIMQKNFNKLVKWSHDMGLVVNSKKTKIMHIRSPQYLTRKINIITHCQHCLHTNLAFQLPCTCSETLETVSEFRYLGVWLDSRFKFDVHIQNLNNRLRSCSYLVFRLRNFVNSATLRTIYCTFIEHLVRYGLQCWGNTTAGYLQSVMRQKYRILKAMCKTRPSTLTHCKSYFRFFKVLPALQLCRYTTVLTFHKNKHYRQVQEHGYETRGANTYVEPRYMNEYGRQLLDNIVPSLYNRLPAAVTQADKYSVLKKELFQWLLESDWLT